MSQKKQKIQSSNPICQECMDGTMGRWDVSSAIATCSPHAPRLAQATMPSPPTSTNRPKNHLIVDATKPYSFSFLKYGREKKVTVDQTAEEATWPGGALWDVGVLMAKLLVMATSPPPPPNSREPYIPRLVEPGVWGPESWRERRVLELGCGVGLTGLVAGAVGARAVLLTDLKVVVEGITQRNVEQNSHLGGNGGAKISAMPLCWGNADDETAAAQELDRLAPPLLPNEKAGGRKKKKKSKSKVINRESDTACTGNLPQSSSILTREGIPDVVLIGDVAYQHRPGSDSHFDILMSTVLRFTDSQTLVLFGTRMRMPASEDLLEMFRKHFDEIVEPIEAHEIDKSFASANLGRKHNITIHLLRRKNDEARISVAASEVPNKVV